jgi:hypothetical protein
MISKETIAECASNYGRRGRDFFTYIAKDKNSDTYKIGHSASLRSRIVSLRNCFYFKRLDYELIAFTPMDIEEYVQKSIIKAGGIPIGDPRRKGKKPMELFVLESDDIDKVIDSFCFQRTMGGMVPVSYVMDKNGENECLLFRYNITSWVPGPKRRIHKQNRI